MPKYSRFSKKDEESAPTAEGNSEDTPDEAVDEPTDETAADEAALDEVAAETTYEDVPVEEPTTPDRIVSFCIDPQTIVDAKVINDNDGYLDLEVSGVGVYQQVRPGDQRKEAGTWHPKE